MILMWVFGSLINGYLKTVEHNDISFLLMGWAHGLPALVFVMFMYPLMV
jgi:hypothetical protein